MNALTFRHVTASYNSSQTFAYISNAKQHNLWAEGRRKWLHISETNPSANIYCHQHTTNFYIYIYQTSRHICMLLYMLHMSLYIVFNHMTSPAWHPVSSLRKKSQLVTLELSRYHYSCEWHWLCPTFEWFMCLCVCKWRWDMVLQEA